MPQLGDAFVLANSVKIVTVDDMNRRNSYNSESYLDHLIEMSESFTNIFGIITHHNIEINKNIKKNSTVL